MRKFVSFFGEQSELFEKLNAETAAYAREKDIDYLWAPQVPYDVEDVVRHLREADAGLIDVEPYGDAIFERLGGRCKLLVRFGVGYEKVDLEAASRHGICVARTTGANKTGVAEMALAMMLAAGRQFMINRATVNSGVWVKNIGRELLGKKVGILGFGNIGEALARRLSGFDCEIVAYDTFQNTEAASAVGVRFADLDEIFTTCDTISVHLPYSAATHHLVNAARIAQMKPEAIIVCTARGNIVDEDALYEALKARKIAGAGLDVFATEPLPATSRLIELDNIILTPHVSSQTYESIKATYHKAVDIVADFFAGRALSPADLLNPDYASAKAPVIV